ncbi:MAG: hypothetical protein BMS9Abin36_1873 [Gammaproteobacteria bacterium]|nr:MAG: hypothetical protein BMS9Abin36_1873 [Gammaproteobacteria bacterium]
MFGTDKAAATNNDIPATGFVVEDKRVLDLTSLSVVELFKYADHGFLEKSLTDLSIISIDAGETLMSVGQLNLNVYIVLEGQLRIHPESADSRPLGLIDIGQCAGLVSAIQEMASAETIIASEKTDLLILSNESLMTFVKEDHGIARAFSELFIQFIRNEHYVALEESTFTKRISYVDDVTGVHNRRWLKRILPRAISRAAMNDTGLSAILLSINDYPEFINDFGSELGNQMLFTTAQTLLNKCRPTDLIARYDKDRFVILLPETNLDGAGVLAGRLIEKISSTEVVIPHECVLPAPTVSIGMHTLKGLVSDSVFLTELEHKLEAAGS